MTPQTGPPFRAEHVGSFQRPDALARAARAFRAGEIGADAFRAAQDRAIADIVAFQEGIGLKSVTDGEFRRRGWSAGFIDAVEGFGLRKGALTFRTSGDRLDADLSPYAEERLRRTAPIVADDFRYLSAIARAMPKVTMPSPPVMHFFLGPRSVEAAVYPDIEDYFADLGAIYRAEIAELAAAGCRYLQLDDTALPCNCDAVARAGVRERGEDPDRLTERYAALINDALKDRPADMVAAIHLCRGNRKGTWMAEGGYEPIAEVLFNEVAVDAYFLEFDTPRAGDFSPLRFVPDGKTVVLGLVSTKTPELESADELRRRIDEASRYVPLDRLCLSPQCGFASAPGGGQVIDHDDEIRKLTLILEVAAQVWG